MVVFTCSTSLLTWSACLHNNIISVLSTLHCIDFGISFPPNTHETTLFAFSLCLRRVWRYQRGNRIRKSKDRQHNGQKKKYKTKRSTAHIHKTNDRVTRTPLKTGGEIRCSGKVNSTCSTNGILRDHLVTNPVISREWEKDREVLTTSGTNPWSFVTQIFHNGQPSHGGDRKTFEVMTST